MSQQLYEVTQKVIDTLRKDNQKGNDLSPDQALDQELIADFICLICLCLVKEMLSCMNCNKLYCKMCVKDWIS